VSNITETITQVNFPNYFASFTPRNYPAEVVVTYPAYTRSLTSILNQTDTDVLEAYLVTRAALVLAPRLGTSTESWKAVRHLQEVLQGIKPGSVGDRAEYCVDSVDQALGFATGRYFVNETFAGDSKEKGTKVITGKSLTSSCGFLIYFAQILWIPSRSHYHLYLGWMRSLLPLPLKRSPIPLLM
jgi:endothelin-converting enzyme